MQTNLVNSTIEQTKNEIEQTKNEVDYVLIQHTQIIQDIDVVNRLTTGIGCRMVRCKVLINSKLERARRHKLGTANKNLRNY